MANAATLTVPALRKLEEAQRSARNIGPQVARLARAGEALRLPKQSKPRSGPPRIGDAAPPDFDRAAEWMNDVHWIRGLAAWPTLIGQVNVRMSYDRQTNAVTFRPPLDQLAALGEAARGWAAAWLDEAPLAELEEARLACLDLFRAIDIFHSYQVNDLGRLTPAAFEDGSAASLTLAFQARYPKYIASLQPMADRVNKAMSKLSRELTSRASQLR
jgi:hypothetical protein